MSVKCLNWAFGIQLDPVKKILLISLADSANDDGECFPGYAELARKSSICKRTVMRNVRKLEEMGLVVITERMKGNRRSSNIYHLQTQVTEPLEEKPTSNEGGKALLKDSDNESLPPSDTKSPQKGDEKNLPDDTESLGGDSKSQQVVTPEVTLTITNRHLTTDPDTDSTPAQNSDVDSGCFGSHLLTGCHPYLYWFLRCMEDRHSKGRNLGDFADRFIQFGFTGGYVQSALGNFLKARRQDIDRKLLSNKTASDYPLMEELIDDWEPQAEFFIQEADEALIDFRSAKQAA